MVRSHQPRGALESYVERFWYCSGYDGIRRQERVLPDGRFQLVVSLSAAPLRAPGDTRAELGRVGWFLVLGLRSRFTVIDTSMLQSAMGVVFRPGGARAFFDEPAAAFSNESVPLEQVWGGGAGDLRERLGAARTVTEKFRVLEETLVRQIDQRRQLHGAVRYALREMTRGCAVPSVLDVAREAGLSRRRFAQLFREQVGFTPKLYCRLARFQSVLRRIGGSARVDWADVALAGGFCDQPHLVHEFREFSGISPGTYLASQRPAMNRVPME
ncbi:MAG TPA: helix-turn-helix domain-containing protein [Myxococcaceae bacterium]|jgi:AraC-like DNA-binding protein